MYTPSEKRKNAGNGTIDLKPTESAMNPLAIGDPPMTPPLPEPNPPVPDPNPSPDPLPPPYPPPDPDPAPIPPPVTIPEINPGEPSRL
jgi:hypothetical protein